MSVALVQSKELIDKVSPRRNPAAKGTPLLKHFKGLFLALAKSPVHLLHTYRQNDFRSAIQILQVCKGWPSLASLLMARLAGLSRYHVLLSRFVAA